MATGISRPEARFACPTLTGEGITITLYPAAGVGGNPYLLNFAAGRGDIEGYRHRPHVQLVLMNLHQLVPDRPKVVFNSFAVVFDRRAGFR